MSHHASPATDTLVLDLDIARRLAAALTTAADELHFDQVALRSLLDDATRLLHRDRTGAMVPLVSARRTLDVLAGDLRRRIALIEADTAALADIDALTGRLTATGTEPTATGLFSILDARRARILELVAGNVDHATRIERELARGATALEAVRIVHAELRHEARVEEVMTGFAVDAATARAMLARADRQLATLIRRGVGPDEAATAVALVAHFGLGFDVALAYADAERLPILEALGRMLAARALGVSLVEYRALVGLEAHFAALDAARGTRDHRVSVADLNHVVGRPWAFTPGQVAAARALLQVPELRNRLDTATENDDLFSGAGFGRTEPGDGLISEDDLRSFLHKAQLHQILGDYADEIDIANDPSGRVDGFRSQADFRAFLADNPDLPAPVVAAAESALTAGWFDESWWQHHKDELAMAAAVLGAGLVVVLTGGTASILAVVGAGVLAGGGATVAVNLATGEPVLDDVVLNAVKGGFIGTGVHGVGVGVTGYAAATTGLARVASFAGVTAGAADVVSVGGLDLLLEEEYEAVIHEVAADVGTLANTVVAGQGVVDWSAGRRGVAAPDHDPLASIGRQIDALHQQRHIGESPLDAGGGYFSSAADPQRLLDALHGGSAEVLGTVDELGVLVRFDGVVALLPSESGGPPVATNTFVVLRTDDAAVVVPVRPAAAD